MDASPFSNSWICHWLKYRSLSENDARYRLQVSPRIQHQKYVDHQRKVSTYFTHDLLSSIVLLFYCSGLDLHSCTANPRPVQAVTDTHSHKHREWIHHSSQAWLSLKTDRYITSRTFVVKTDLQQL